MADVILVLNAGSSSIKFSAYQDSAIIKNPGASVIVGMGTQKGQSVGFVLEVGQGRGALWGSLLPAAIASYHRVASDLARAKGCCLMDVLVDKARQKQST